MFGRRDGKMLAASYQIEDALRRGKSVVIAVVNQQDGIAMWKKYFPDALFTLVGDWGLKIHKRKNRRVRKRDSD